MFCKEWGNGLNWVSTYVGGPYESKILMLDCSKIKSLLNWKSRWHMKDAVKQTVDWYKCFSENGNINDFMNHQIHEFWTKD